MRDDNCIFCKIANGEIPSETIYEDETFRVIIAIGNFLMLSPSFPPLHTVHETFASYGVPSYPNRFISYFPVIVWYP